ncbi:MAG: hypothetical protein GQ527_09210 [Bacteroidales bacterium]|nr:hypothetical protein [Bacteroidales bacterium]
MAKRYDWKAELCSKSEEELFHIYIGSTKHLPKNIRYQAARILENRDFQFDQINDYKEIWKQEKLQQRNNSTSTIFSSFVAFLNNSTQEIREKKTVIELSH